MPETLNRKYEHQINLKETCLRVPKDHAYKDQDQELCRDGMVRVMPCERESEAQVLLQLGRNENQEEVLHCHRPSYLAI
jgi:hypothetical protein